METISKVGFVGIGFFIISEIIFRAWNWSDPFGTFLYSLFIGFVFAVIVLLILDNQLRQNILNLKV
jgi:uncharacterized membrane protein YeaQ/YmgE (transglycosylase-associated protein family)